MKDAGSLNLGVIRASLRGSLFPRLLAGTLQLLTCCSAINFSPSRFFPVSSLAASGVREDGSEGCDILSSSRLLYGRSCARIGYNAAAPPKWLIAFAARLAIYFTEDLSERLGARVSAHAQQEYRLPRAPSGPQ